MSTSEQIFGDAIGRKHAADKEARCSVCGETYMVTELAYKLAMYFHSVLVARGEQGLPGVGYCPACAEVFEDKQQERAADRMQRDEVLFRRMRKGLAGIKQGKLNRYDVNRFLAELPRDFTAEHNESVMSFKHSADQAFAKADESGASGWDDFK